jgi:hypothetical protein
MLVPITPPPTMSISEVAAIASFPAAVAVFLKSDNDMILGVGH